MSGSLRLPQADPQTWLAAFLFTLKWLSVAGVASLYLWHTSLPQGPNDPWSLAAQDFSMAAFSASYFYFLAAGALVAGALVQLLKYSRRTAALCTIGFAVFALIVAIVLMTWRPTTRQPLLRTTSPLERRWMTCSMEIFAQEADRLFATYGVGDTRVLLGLRLGKGTERPSLVKLPAVGDRPFAPLAEPEILTAVLDGVHEANTVHNTHYCPDQILYVANDPPNYHLYKLCASLIISRVAVGAEFPPMKPNES